MHTTQLATPTMHTNLMEISSTKNQNKHFYLDKTQLQGKVTKLADSQSMLTVNARKELAIAIQLN